MTASKKNMMQKVAVSLSYPFLGFFPKRTQWDLQKRFPSYDANMASGLTIAMEILPGLSWAAKGLADSAIGIYHYSLSPSDITLAYALGTGVLRAMLEKEYGLKKDEPSRYGDVILEGISKPIYYAYDKIRGRKKGTITS